MFASDRFFCICCSRRAVGCSSALLRHCDGDCLRTHYWEPYYNETAESDSSTVVKLVGVMIILMLFIGSASVYLFLNPPGGAPTGTAGRVAVVDSGADLNYVEEQRVVARQSFIRTVYGYSGNDLSTDDTRPGGVPHGTIVAETILSGASSARLVIAKVLDNEGHATSPAIIAAIQWAVEQGVDVINLSLGSTPTIYDSMRDIVEWAFRHGVVVVAAAGNEGDHGIRGNSINSPAVFQYAIAAAALNESGMPAHYSSWGPTAGRTMKPDIAARGYVVHGNKMYVGTSFSAPRVAAAAARVIDYCVTNDIPWTPGMVKAVLMAGATEMPYPEYVVGAGKLNADAALALLQEEATTGNRPPVTYVHPGSLPLDFERLFFGDNYTFEIEVINSWTASYSVEVQSTTPGVFSLPGAVTVNQTGYVTLTIAIPDDGTPNYWANITFSSATAGTAGLLVNITAGTAVARVAFDIVHTPWTIDTTYGQFKELYRLLTASGISVTEIRERAEITADRLARYDGVVVLDPCAWGSNETDPLSPSLFSIEFSDQETSAYEEYVTHGGGLFVAALDNSSLDIASANEFLQWTGIALADDYIRRDSSDPVVVTSIHSHPITTGVSSFDYYGAPLVLPAGAVLLAQYAGDAVLGALETSGGGRVVVSGSNFFIDNWGLLGEYYSSQDARLALRIVLWTCGLL